MQTTNNIIEMNAIVYNDTIAMEIQSKVKHYESETAKLIADLSTNVTSRLPWIGEALYTTDYYRVLWADLLKTITEGEFPATALNQAIIHADRFLKCSYNVRENSTGVFHRECSTMRYQVMLDMYNKMIELRNHAQRAVANNS